MCVGYPCVGVQMYFIWNANRNTNCIRNVCWAPLRRHASLLLGGWGQNGCFSRDWAAARGRIILFPPNNGRRIIFCLQLFLAVATQHIPAGGEIIWTIGQITINVHLILQEHLKEWSDPIKISCCRNPGNEDDAARSVNGGKKERVGFHWECILKFCGKDAVCG